MNHIKEDLTGKRFGKLVVLERAENHYYPKGGSCVMWKCQCDCGGIKIANGQKLKNGTIRSCGCLINAITPNKYDLSHEDYGIGYDSNGKTFLFDKEDYDLVKTRHWFVSKTRVTASLHNKPISLHHFILGEEYKDKLIDHKNHDFTDNRKSNLRVADKQTNGINRPANKNNKLGVKGVFFDNRVNKYIARIYKNGKTYWIGSYCTLEEAKQARVQKEIELFGEFAYIQ